MNVGEANMRLKKAKITEEQLFDIHNLYCLLDLDKDDFCKIVDAVGVDKLIERKSYYNWLEQARLEAKAKDEYLKAKEKLKDLEEEKKRLEDIMNDYENSSLFVIKL